MRPSKLNPKPPRMKEESLRVTSAIFNPKEQKSMMKVIKKAKEGEFKKDNLNETVRCYRCKMFGHSQASKICPLYEHGKKLAETERKIRMDPNPIMLPETEGGKEKKDDLGMFVKLDPTLDEKILKLMTLTRLIKEERKAKKKKKKKKKKKRSGRRKRKRSEGNDDYFEEYEGRKRRKI